MPVRTFLRIAAPWLAILAVGAIAALLRYYVIEPANLAEACEGPGGPNWCPVRMGVVHGFLTYGYGYVALAAVALALFVPRRWTAALAGALGLFALQLYCFEAGAFALLVGSLRLARLQANQEPGAPDDQGDREIQASP
jgi:hypothetical protein